MCKDLTGVRGRGMAGRDRILTTAVVGGALALGLAWSWPAALALAATLAGVAAWREAAPTPESACVPASPLRPCWDQVRLDVALQSAGLGTWEHDLPTKRSSFDDRQLELFGRTRATFDGSEAAVFAVIHPDDRAAVYAALDRVIAGPDAPPWEFRVVDSDGKTLRWVQGHGKRVTEPGIDRVIGISLDITERKGRELALKDAERRYRLALEAGSLATVCYEPVSGRVSGDARAQELLHLPDGPVPVGRLYESVAAGDRAAVERALTAAATGESTAVEFAVGPGPASRYCSLSGRVTEPGSGRVVAVVADVTARRLAQESLESSQRNYALAERVARVGSYSKDLTTGETWWSDEMYRLLGYRPGEVRPSCEAIVAQVPAERRDPLFHEIHTAVAAGGNKSVEFTTAIPGEEPRVLALELLVTSEAVSPPRLHGTMQDVTERRRTEDQLRSAGDRLRVAQRVANLGDWELDWATGTLDPGGVAELWGLPRTPLPLDTFLDHLPAEERGRVRHALGRAASGEAVAVEHRFHHPAHGVRHFVLRAVGSPGHPVRGSGQDVTAARLELEQQLESEIRLQNPQKLESLGVLASGIAHDFNNLLTSILGHANLARDLVGPASELHGYLDPIEKASLRAAQLCQQMLTYAGKGDTVRGPVDLNELVRTSADLMRLMLPKAGELRLELSAEPLQLVGDANQLRQAVLSLVQNAAEALPPAGGAVTVASHRGADGELVIEVRDTGGGIPLAALARVFEPFYTTKFCGRGLGLSAVHGIARSHHGRIEASSPPGSGAVFRLALPTADRPPPEVPPMTADTPSPRPTALLIDDEPLIRNMARICLTNFGYHVVEAEGGAEGLARFHDNPSAYSVVILDLTMPEVDGLAVLAGVRRLAPALPVVLMSGYLMDSNADLVFGPGLVFLQKPFRAAELAQALKQVMPGRPAPSPAGA